MPSVPEDHVPPLDDVKGVRQTLGGQSCQTRRHEFAEVRLLYELISLNMSDQILVKEETDSFVNKYSENIRSQTLKKSAEAFIFDQADHDRLV